MEDKRSPLQSLTIQALIIAGAFSAIQQADLYLSGLETVPDWMSYGRDVLHKLMVDAGALIALTILGSIGVGIFGRMRVGDLQSSIANFWRDRRLHP